MAATFIVEDGTGLADANSFCSAAFADQYMEDYGDSAVWSSLTDGAAKEEHLRLGTRYLEAIYRLRWPGSPSLGTQRLPLPRIYASDVDGFALASDEVWLQVREACALAALKSAEGTLSHGTVTAPGSLKSKRLKIGDIVIDKSWTNGEIQLPLFSDISGIMSRIIVPGNITERA